MPYKKASDRKKCTIRWQKNNPEKHKANQKKYKRKQHLKEKYGLTLDQYKKMLSLQKNKCGICSNDLIKYSRNFSVDHDHKNGKIRSLLCYKCNTLLGMSNDSIKILEKCIKYLKKHKV